jgi:hypothetical protein
MRPVDPWADPRGPGPLVHEPIPQDIQYKNNLIFIENSWRPVILQKHPRIFQNYILVPVILHVGPCINFIFTIRSFSSVIQFILFPIQPISLKHL